ncbi:hypothetical protein AVEN_259841-1 [Araneus ventricosus]|uniref:Uncharacterized protein n=1 Tax=Araneus ventricosus TaxID=182803 RepID=A0A4Y2FU99_ARAVE|nr:hypothetical protein AVEN_259841-1 [Araneus ventricosus]
MNFNFQDDDHVTNQISDDKLLSKDIFLLGHFPKYKTIADATSAKHDNVINLQRIFKDPLACFTKMDFFDILQAFDDIRRIKANHSLLSESGSAEENCFHLLLKKWSNEIFLDFGSSSPFYSWCEVAIVKLYKKIK